MSSIMASRKNLENMSHKTQVVASDTSFAGTQAGINLPPGVAPPKPPATLLSSFKGIDTSLADGTDAPEIISASRQLLEKKKAAQSREQDEELIHSFGRGFALPLVTNLVQQRKGQTGNMLLEQVTDSFVTKDTKGEWSKRGTINKQPGPKNKKALSKKQKQRKDKNQDRGEAYSEKVSGGKMVQQKRKNRLNRLKKIY